MIARPRRLRRNQNIRDLVQETHLRIEDFIYPMFVIDAAKSTKMYSSEIKSMPGIHRYGIDALLLEIETVMKLGVRAIALFPVIAPDLKDLEAKEAFNPNGLTQRAVRAIKARFPDLIVATDVALDPYTLHGHDGLLGVPLNPSRRKLHDEFSKQADVQHTAAEILNDATVAALCRMALVQAEAGADIVAPSDMMDGRIAAIRGALDSVGFQDVSIMSYTAKYASCMYSPFRDALGSLGAPLENPDNIGTDYPSNEPVQIHPEAPRMLIPKDKKTYQMNPANSREAFRELQLDISEGADIVMVKPAGMYLDVISKFKANSPVPVAAYQVSGEYAMIHAAAEKGIVDLSLATWESLIAIKRAGADIILSYFVKSFSKQ